MSALSFELWNFSNMAAHMWWSMGFRSGLFGDQESLSVKSEQCLPSDSFCSLVKFVLETCVAVNLAYVK